ncbi:MAG: hypothetical protein RLZZ366_1321 [Pseudomonadota bacterium]|jgi:hypothetical protein
MKCNLTFLALISLSVAACGGSPNDPGVGGVTKAEAEALNEAAAKLDEATPPPRLDLPAEDSGPAKTAPK